MRKKLTIEGMSCGHCVKRVQEALQTVEGVQSVTVDLEAKTAVLELIAEVEGERLKAAVEEAGYDVKRIE
ncbi:MAG: heavy-metal-associated domain-containing protein [Firmicutes bacterium]|nr:heavy-metal-associated domain-containing protein [Bacillota bacterium]